ncbi:MAG: MerR family transcriptional regulator [Defluviitaleaceae bacterium]|nr:MerR family transcriptional regulator [Defluviitaleaceae bacterium]
MEMANCVRCRKLFPKFKEPICEDCKKKDEELFKIVKDYLDSTPSATIQEISNETGASTKKILAWLREGRLELAETTGDLKCKQCGIDITSGQFCDSCVMEINRQIDGIISERPSVANNESAKKGIVMHTKNRK